MQSVQRPRRPRICPKVSKKCAADELRLPARDTQATPGIYGSFTRLTRFLKSALFLIFMIVFVDVLAWAVMVLLPAVGPTLVVIPLIAIGNGAALPALLALVTYLAAPGQRGFAIGTLVSAQGPGRVIGPALAGLFFERWHPSAPIAVAAAL